MKRIASDIMTTNFHTLNPQLPVHAAVKVFKQASNEEGRKIFGMMVTDDEGHLVGMIEGESHVPVEFLLQEERRRNTAVGLGGAPDLDGAVQGTLDLLPEDHALPDSRG